MSEEKNGKGDKRRKENGKRFRQNYALIFDKFEIEFLLHDEEEKPKKKKKSKDKS